MEGLIEALVKGWRGFRAVEVLPGRYVWERNLTLHLNGRFVMYLKVFRGHSYYRPWVEAFEIEDWFHTVEEERELYALIFEKSPPLSRIFVEYSSDPETERALRLGVPPELSRLGYNLLKVGYRNLRNWYYPEGLKEGGPKLQGEKLAEGYRPRDPTEEIRRFIRTANREYPEVERALRRVEEVLSLFGDTEPR